MFFNIIKLILSLKIWTRDITQVILGHLMIGLNHGHCTFSLSVRQLRSVISSKYKHNNYIFVRKINIFFKIHGLGLRDFK